MARTIATALTTVVFLVTVAAASGPGRRVDVDEGLEVWSFSWERNRERLLHEILGRRVGRARFSPWGSSWVLGRGKKATRRIEPVRPVTSNLVAKEIRPALFRGLRRRHPLVRDAAVVALGKVGGGEVVPALVERAFRDTAAEVRQDATLALGLTGLFEAVPALVDILRGEGIPGGRAAIDARCFAALALGVHSAEREIPLLTVLAEAFRDEMRGGADSCLLASLALAIGLRDGERAASTLGEWLRDRDLSEMVRVHVATALGKTGHPSAARSLMAAYRRAGRMVRGAIALSLGSFPDAPVPTFLEKEGLHDGEGQNQNFAAISLARVADRVPADSAARRSALEHLRWRALKPERNTTLAEHAALGLALLGDTSLVSDFQAMATDRRHKQHVRSAMALSLGILGDRESAALLLEILENRGEDPKLRCYAAIGLALLGEGADVLRRRYSLAADPESRVPDVQRGCVLGVGILGALGHGEGGVDFLSDVLGSARERNVRGAAVIAFGLMRDASAVPALVKIADSPASSVEDRAYALAALGHLGDKDPFPAHCRLFENGSHRVTYRQLDEVLRML